MLQFTWETEKKYIWVEINTYIHMYYIHTYVFMYIYGFAVYQYTLGCYPERIPNEPIIVVASGEGNQGTE